jgi:hypothetical protein
MTEPAKTGTGAATSEAPAGSTSSTTPETKTGETAATGGTTTETKAGEAPAGETAPKAGDTGKAATEGKAGEATTPKAPEKYALTVPDDMKAGVDDQLLGQLETVARGQDMSQDEAQAFLEDTLARIKVQSDAWANETKSDKTYGGDKLPETQRLAKLAIDKVRPVGHPMRDAFNNFLARGGSGNHIQVVSFLADLGRMMGEDAGPAGHKSSAGAQTTADKAAVIYDHPDSVAANKG